MLLPPWTITSIFKSAVLVSSSAKLPRAMLKAVAPEIVILLLLNSPFEVNTDMPEALDSVLIRWLPLRT